MQAYNRVEKAFDRLLRSYGAVPVIK